METEISKKLKSTYYQLEIREKSDSDVPNIKVNVIDYMLFHFLNQAHYNNYIVSIINKFKKDIE